MNFPDLFNKSASRIYFGLFLKESEGVGIIIREEAGQMRIIEREKFKYSNGWENLIEDVDDVLYRIEQKLNIKVKDTILFVYSHFVDARGSIKHPYIAKIKELSKSLELNPLGYIECIEAVVKFLEEQDQTPLTAIVVELDKTKLSLFVYKGGRLVHRDIVDKSESLVSDLTSIFGNFKEKILLPARIILYNSNDLDEESTKIMSHRWSEDYFVQIPRVEIIKEHDAIEKLVKIFEEQTASKENLNRGEVAQKSEVFGFKVGEDVGQGEVVEEKREEIIHPPPKTPFKLNFKLPKLPALPALPSLRLNIPKRISIFIGIFLIFLALLLNEYFFHKVTITLYLPFQAINKSMDTTADLKESSQTADYSETEATTGIREIGDKAKGVVMVDNFSDTPKNFEAGTLIDSGGVKFSLDAGVTASSSSIVMTSSGPVKQPGQVKASVTATNIGSEANLAKGKIFTVDSFPQATYMAINSDSFKGGSKTQIRTVAKKDMDDLKTKIGNKAKTGVQKNDLPDLAQVEFKDTNFSKEVGEESDSVTLKAKVNVMTFTYDRTKFVQNIISKLSSTVPSGYVLTPSYVDYNIDSLKRTDNTAYMKITVKAKAIKDVSEKDILASIVGKPKNSIEAILKNNYQIQGYLPNISDPLPISSSFLPFFKRNITLKISSL